jgi:hypothetical protein
MSTEPVASADVEAEKQTSEVQPKVETAVEPVSETVAEPVAAQSEEGKEPEDEIAKELKRLKRRVDKRTADIYRIRAENEQLKAQLSQKEASLANIQETHALTDPVTLAKEISRIDRFTEKSNEIVGRGLSKHTDYLPVLRDLSSEVGDFVLPSGAPSRFMEVVLEVSEKPHELLYYLGKNPEIASDLADLTPAKLATRLDRIEREMAETSKPKTSSAPKPIEPVKPAGTPMKDPSKMTDREFAAWRRAQIAQRH